MRSSVAGLRMLTFVSLAGLLHSPAVFPEQPAVDRSENRAIPRGGADAGQRQREEAAKAYEEWRRYKAQRGEVVTESYEEWQRGGRRPQNVRVVKPSEIKDLQQKADRAKPAMKKALEEWVQKKGPVETEDTLEELGEFMQQKVDEAVSDRVGTSNGIEVKGNRPKVELDRPKARQENP